MEMTSTALDVRRLAMPTATATAPKLTLNGHHHHDMGRHGDRRMSSSSMSSMSSSSGDDDVGATSIPQINMTSIMGTAKLLQTVQTVPDRLPAVLPPPPTTAATASPPMSPYMTGLPPSLPSYAAASPAIHSAMLTAMHGAAAAGSPAGAAAAPSPPGMAAATAAAVMAAQQNMMSPEMMSQAMSNVYAMWGEWSLSNVAAVRPSGVWRPTRILFTSATGFAPV